jgi:hypothetical protein
MENHEPMRLAHHGPKRLLFLALRCEPSAPRSARIALGSVLHPGQPHDDAALVTSELVTNAVQFSGCTVAERITLTVARRGDCLRIAVHDPAHTAQEPHQREPSQQRIGGQGLRIVAQLARSWGVEARGNGRTVWAELPGPVSVEEPTARGGLRVASAIHPNVVAPEREAGTPRTDGTAESTSAIGHGTIRGPSDRARTVDSKARRAASRLLATRTRRRRAPTAIPSTTCRAPRPPGGWPRGTTPDGA